MKVRIADTTIQDIVNYNVSVNWEIHELLTNNELDNNIYEDFSKYYTDYRGKYIEYDKFVKILRSISVDTICKKLNIQDNEDYYSAVVDGKWIKIYIEVDTRELNKYIIKKLEEIAEERRKNQEFEYGTGWDLSQL